MPENTGIIGSPCQAARVNACASGTATCANPVTTAHTSSWDSCGEHRDDACFTGNIERTHGGIECEYVRTITHVKRLDELSREQAATLTHSSLDGAAAPAQRCRMAPLRGRPLGQIDCATRSPCCPRCIAGWLNSATYWPTLSREFGCVGARGTPGSMPVALSPKASGGCSGPLPTGSSGRTAGARLPMAQRCRVPVNEHAKAAGWPFEQSCRRGVISGAASLQHSTGIAGQHRPWHTVEQRRPDSNQPTRHTNLQEGTQTERSTIDRQHLPILVLFAIHHIDHTRVASTAIQQALNDFGQFLHMDRPHALMTTRRQSVDRQACEHPEESRRRACSSIDERRSHDAVAGKTTKASASPPPARLLQTSPDSVAPRDRATPVSPADARASRSPQHRDRAPSTRLR